MKKKIKKSKCSFFSHKTWMKDLSPIVFLALLFVSFIIRTSIKYQYISSIVPIIEFFALLFPFLCIGLLISGFISLKKNKKMGRLYIYSSIVLLILYFVWWIYYMANKIT